MTSIKKYASKIDAVEKFRRRFGFNNYGDIVPGTRDTCAMIIESDNESSNIEFATVDTYQSVYGEAMCEAELAEMAKPDTTFNACVVIYRDEDKYTDEEFDAKLLTATSVLNRLMLSEYIYILVNDELFVNNLDEYFKKTGE